MQAALDSEVISGSARGLVVAGHSLGAGIGTLMAYAAAKYLAAKAPFKRVVVDAVLFGSPAGERGLRVQGFRVQGSFHSRQRFWDE